MEKTEMKEMPRQGSKIVARILLCLLLLVVGLAGMFGLSVLKKAPAKVIYEEHPIRVRAVEAVMESAPVIITGYGELHTLDTVVITPEVTGKIVAVHPRLEPGEFIARGALLFAIEPTNYEASKQEAVASVKQIESTLDRLRMQLSIDKDRLVTLLRNRELAAAEYERVKKLFDINHVGTRSGVDAAEQAMNTALDRADQMAQNIAIYPIRIKESQSALAMAKAKLLLAKANLNRCRVSSPIDGRIKEVQLELGQFVGVGQNAVTLADDSVLEVQVPLDSRDARKWLQFEADGKNTQTAWFNKVVPVSCRVVWTEASDGGAWTGTLHRVVRFDQQTRSLTVAIRIGADQAHSGGAALLPLVEGMFCRVEIPGKTMENVLRLPRWAVSFQNTVYLAKSDRLKTVSVKLARVQGEEAFVAEGIQPGDWVVTTRLVDPLEDALLLVDTKTPTADSNKKSQPRVRNGH